MEKLKLEKLNLEDLKLEELKLEELELEELGGNRMREIRDKVGGEGGRGGGHWLLLAKQIHSSSKPENCVEFESYAILGQSVTHPSLDLLTRSGQSVPDHRLITYIVEVSRSQ